MAHDEPIICLRSGSASSLGFATHHKYACAKRLNLGDLDEISYRALDFERLFGVAQTVDESTFGAHLEGECAERIISIADERFIFDFFG